MDNNLTFSKIVATPTLNSWSQAYNAGKLFAVLSLERTKELPIEIESLNMFGKDLLERLEQEFFVIENKNLESIKKAISIVFENPIDGLTTSFSAGVLVGNILYLFCVGNAKVYIKRAGNIGLALDCGDATPHSISTSSGFLKEGDIIVLTTDAFSQVITPDDLTSSLADVDPSEITESLAPKIHKAENGKISAIVIKYAQPIAEEVIDEGLVESETEEIKHEEEVMKKAAPFQLKIYFDLIKSKFSPRWSFGEAGRKPNVKIVPTKKLFLIAAIAIVGILVFSIFFAIQEQNNAKVRAIFAQVYPQAQKKYDEGQGLLDLNKNFARDAFTAAEKILNDNKAQFPPKSKEAIQAQDLLTKIDAGLALVSPIDKSGLDRTTLSITVQNGSGAEGAAGKAATILKDAGYNSPSTGNADNFNYEGVTIKVKVNKNDFLNLLNKDLSREYTVTASSSDLPLIFPTDALIIIGK